MDYWGITNMDVVYGNLDHFIPDSELEKYDVWTDDVKDGKPVVNGVFSLWKNIDEINNLCYQIPDWREKLTCDPCPKCMGVQDQIHHLYGTDEIDMVPIVQNLPKTGDFERVGCPPHYPLHTYDRLEQHIPEPKLRVFPDGSLYELYKDFAKPELEFGREVMYFHFSYTKKWPSIA
jgi:hypothetical protein